MNLLTALFDAVVGFIQRNPITCLVLLILAVAAPAVLKGIAVFVLYFILGLVVLGVLLMLSLRWRIYKMRKQMGDQFGEQGGFSANPFGQNPFAGRRPDPSQEGEVKVFRTEEAPEKRIRKDVGDYVEFEETDDTK